MGYDSLALVGAGGGAGVTRLTLECATLLSHDGRDVAVLDAAYATQGLADRTPGRIDPDMTALCLEKRPLEVGLLDREAGAGRLAVCPARAPFERMARAKTPDAAAAFEDRIAEAARAFDHVLVDVPPVAANQAVAAVSATEAVAVVADAARADDAVPRARDRLVDVGVDPAATVVTRATDHPDADATVPTLSDDLPAVEGDETARDRVGAVLEATMGLSVDVGEDAESLRDRLPI